MSACWELRGCDEEMQGRCPHNLPGEPCPAECHFAACDRPTHKVTSDPLSILNPEIDFDAAIKEGCRMCEFFLAHGPKFVDNQENRAERKGNPNRFIL